MRIRVDKKLCLYLIMSDLIVKSYKTYQNKYICLRIPNIVLNIVPFLFSLRMRALVYSS